MRTLVLALALAALPACSNGGNGSFDLANAEEYGFRQLREDLHHALTTGDRALLRSLWTDDAMLITPDGVVLVGGDIIADYYASRATFGTALSLTAEGSWRIGVTNDIAQIGFESIAVDVGGGDPRNTMLATDGAQNPAVEIVGHSHSTGIAVILENGKWAFHELEGAVGPLPPAAVLTQVTPGQPSVELGDELGFRRMREAFHSAGLLGDYALMRSVWADDGVFRGGPDVFVGGDAVTDFFASSPGWGRTLTLTPESSQRLVVNGNTIEYGFECIAIDVGENDPATTPLCTDGAQNPAVQIVRHTNSQGFATRVADGRWVFQEFNGSVGPLPPAGQ